MSKTGKVIIGIAIGFFIIVVGVVTIGIYWWTHYAKELKETGTKNIEQGKEFGKKATEQGCVDEAVARYKANSGFSSSISTGLFLKSCLEESTPTPGFCDQIPKQSEILKSVQWQLGQAEKTGIRDDFGRHLFSQIQIYCDEKRAKSKR